MARRWTASTSPTSAVSSSHQGWLRTVDLLNWLVDHWDQPEEGTWETRGGRKNFTYGRLMSGVAMDRGIRLATTHGRPAPLERWQRERNAIYNQIMSRGWSPQRKALVQEYDNTVLDASLLRMPTVDFTTPADPMWTSTLQRMDDELVTDRLVYRYNPEASPDGLRGSEGTFSLCTFAYIDTLARPGRLDDSQLMFEKDADLHQPPRPVLRGNRPHR
jgi:GH15 family glucan-1,4-alpha-glucosidase